MRQDSAARERFWCAPLASAAHRAVRQPRRRAAAHTSGPSRREERESGGEADALHDVLRQRLAARVEHGRHRRAFSREQRREPGARAVERVPTRDTAFRIGKSPPARPARHTSM